MRNIFLVSFIPKLPTGKFKVKKSMFAKNNIYLITHYSQLSPCGHTTMTTERLLGLAMVTIHFETPIDYDAVVHFFCGKIPNSASC